MNTHKPLPDIIAETLGKIDFHRVREHPNILIAAKFWEDDRYEAARTIYRFMRHIDDMIDDRKALDSALSCMEKKLFTDRVNNWIDCLGTDQSRDPLFREVSEIIHRFRIPLHFFINFARAMVYDIHHDGFRTFSGFLEYAEGASNGPASVFVHLCCLEKRHGEYCPPRLAISDVARPCAIFSYLVHIVRDFRKDQFSNLNYFALDIMKKHGLSAADLREIARSGEVLPSFRRMIGEYKEIAGKYRSDTEKMLQSLEGRLDPRYRLSLDIIYHLYLQVYHRIDPEHGKFTEEELNPSPEDVKQNVEESIRNFMHRQVTVTY